MKYHSIRQKTTLHTYKKLLILLVFGTKFRIVNCDLRVVALLEEKTGFWSPSVLESVKKLHQIQPPLEDATEEKQE